MTALLIPVLTTLLALQPPNPAPPTPASQTTPHALTDRELRNRVIISGVMWAAASLIALPVGLSELLEKCDVPPGVSDGCGPLDGPGQVTVGRITTAAVFGAAAFGAMIATIVYASLLGAHRRTDPGPIRRQSRLRIGFSARSVELRF